MVLTRKQFGKEFAERLNHLCFFIEERRAPGETIKTIIGGAGLVFRGKKQRKN